MKTYILECKASKKHIIEEYITKNLGTVEYSSPILPIIGASLNKNLLNKVKKSFDLINIEEEKEGFLQDQDGFLNNTENEKIQMIPGLNYKKLRKHNKTGWGVNVAVLDSGVSEPWIDQEYDFSGFGSSPYIDHGTKVATLIKTFAPGSRISSYKVCQEINVKEVNLMKAIDAAVKNNSNVVNISIGFNNKCTPEHKCNLCKIIDYYSLNNKVLFVSSAGNAGKENSISCPGKAQEAITVGAVDQQNKSIAGYSSRGVPGIKKPNILTTGEIFFRNSNDYGTSFSAPIVTGICSAFSVNNDNISLIKNLLYNTTKDLGLPEHHQGFGLLNLEKMLEVHQIGKSNYSSEGYEQN